MILRRVLIVQRRGDIHGQGLGFINIEDMIISGSSVNIILNDLPCDSIEKMMSHLITRIKARNPVKLEN